MRLIVIAASESKLSKISFRIGMYRVPSENGRFVKNLLD